DPGPDTLELGAKRLTLLNRVLDHHAFAHTSEDRDLLPVVVGRGGVLVEDQVLGQIVGVEHSLLAGDRQLANLRRGQPVDLEDSHRSIREAHEPGDQVFSRRMHLAFRLRIYAYDLGPGQVAHDIEVVRGEVDHHTDVPHAVGERTQPSRVQLKDPACVALAHPPLE